MWASLFPRHHSVSQQITVHTFVQELDLALQKLCSFPRVQVLINTRVRLAFKDAVQLQLASLGAGAATELLRDRCSGPAWDSSAAARLSQMCGGNALCLCIVGSFVTSGRCTMQVSRDSAW